MQDSDAPEKRYGFSELMKALVAWAAVQGMTSEWQEKKWFTALREIPVYDTNDKSAASTPLEESPSKVHVTTDVSYPNHGGQIITADIGDAFPTGPTSHPQDFDFDSISALKSRLRRFSKLVLAGYGGASLLFFGVPPVPLSNPSVSNAEKADEEAKLAMAVGSSEVEASRSRTSSNRPEKQLQGSKADTPSYSWWNMLLGKHDKDILLHYAQNSHVEPSDQVSCLIILVHITAKWP